MNRPSTTPWAVLDRDATEHAWRAGRAAEIEIGHPWEVLRIIRPLGLAVIRRGGIALGPVLDTIPRGAVEFLVAPGTSSTWPALSSTSCRSVNTGTIRCPAPWVTVSNGHRPVNGRRWIVPPDEGHPSATDADQLCELITEVITERVLPSLAPRRRKAELSARSLRALPPCGLSLPPLTSQKHEETEMPRSHAWEVFAEGGLHTPEDARLFTRERLALWHVSPDDTETIVQIVSELVANAVEHAVTRGDVRVSLTHDGYELTVSVTDRGGPHNGLRAICPGHDAESGRGLFLVAVLASGWGWYQVRNGTVVWAQLALAVRTEEREAARRA